MNRQLLGAVALIAFASPLSAQESLPVVEIVPEKVALPFGFEPIRDKAEADLGDKFDIREFHAQVLNTGSLPLQILEQKIDRWIAAKKAS